jgi:hypothetical protein
LTSSPESSTIPTTGRNAAERRPRAVIKKSVAFDEAVGREALKRAGERGFSRFVNDAVARRLQALRVAELLSQLDGELGPVPPDVIADVEAEWDAATRPR